MDYIEYSFQIAPLEPTSEILIAFLESLPFETFIETDVGFDAYAPVSFQAKDLDDILQNEIFQNATISYTTQKVEDRNWNEEWEKDFEPILVDDEIYIKADFHPEKDFPYVIRIQPKMAFGTGHHETTYLMLQMMNELDFEEKEVLDMGSGTAILAIYAFQKGAHYIEAIDIDEWAFDNAKENVKRNNSKVEVKLGDASLLGDKNFDIVLANINKNILLADIPTYVENLKAEGKLVLSGILENDFTDINAVCIQNGLIFEQKKQKNEWISIQYTKP